MEKLEITSASIEEFKLIKDTFEKLPKLVREGLQSAAMIHGTIQYKYKANFGNPVKINVVGNISEIHSTEKGATVYTKYGKFSYPHSLENGIIIDVIDYKLS